MPTGLDVGATTVVVATPEGTTSQRNAIASVESATLEDPDQGVAVESSHGTYVVGDAADRGGDDPPRLFGGGDEVPGDVVKAGIEAFLATYADDERALRYVTFEPGGADPLAPVATDVGYSVDETDAGMAVCYDVFDDPVTGIGIAVEREQAVATLAVGGVSVATARVDPSDDWYTLDDVDGEALEEGGMTNYWFAGRYETLVGDLAAQLAAGTPIPDRQLPVAVGGDAAPSGIEDQIASALSAELPVDVGEVTVADEPAEALARGALVAAEADDGLPASTPVFAEQVPHEEGLADHEGAVTAIGGGVARAHATTKSVTDATQVDGTTDDALAGVDAENVEEAVASAHETLSTLERRGAMTARALSELIGRIEAETGGSDELERLGEKVEAVEAAMIGESAGEVDRSTPVSEEMDHLSEAVESIESEFEELKERSASADVAESLQETVDDLESDVDNLQAVVTDEDSDVEIKGGGSSSIDAVRLDSLEDELEDLETRVSDQMNHVWSELDDITSDIVDISATIEDVPEMEETLGNVETRMMDLNEETDTIWESISRVQDDIDALENKVATANELSSVESELEAVAGDLKSLRRDFNQQERVDPETVDEMQADLEGLRETMSNQAERIQRLEREQSNLDDRIETVFQNSAKSEALASTQTEVSRIRKTASNAKSTADELQEVVDEIESNLDAWQEELGVISTNVDNLAGQAVTRSEVDATVDDLEYRIEEVENQIATQENIERTVYEVLEDADVGGDADAELAVLLLGIGLFLVGGLGAGLALSAGPGYPLIAAGFVVLSAVMGVSAWLVT